MQGMYINGIHSSVVGGFKMYSFQSPIPNSVEERVEILGKQGTTFIGRRWDDRLVKVKCIVVGSDVREELRNLFDYLKVNEEVILNFESDKRVFYIMRFNSFEDIEMVNPRTTNQFNILFKGEVEYYYMLNDLITPDLVVNKEYLDSLIPNIDYIKGINVIKP